MSVTLHVDHHGHIAFSCVIIKNASQPKLYAIINWCVEKLCHNSDLNLNDIFQKVIKYATDPDSTFPKEFIVNDITLTLFDNTSTYLNYTINPIDEEGHELGNVIYGHRSRLCITPETTDRNIVSWIRSGNNGKNTYPNPNMDDVDMGVFLTYTHNMIMDKKICTPESHTFDFEYDHKMYRLTLTAFMTNPDIEKS